VIVKHVASNYNEVCFEFGSLGTQTLERGKSGLTDPVTGVLIKTCNPQTEVKIRGMKKTDHKVTFRGVSSWRYLWTNTLRIVNRQTECPCE
jgi:hypothetical protein